MVHSICRNVGVTRTRDRLGIAWVCHEDQPRGRLTRYCATPARLPLTGVSELTMHCSVRSSSCSQVAWVG